MDVTYSFRWVWYCCFCLFDFHDGDKVIRPLHPSEFSPDGTPPSSRTVTFDYQAPVFNPEDPRCVPPRQWRRYREVVPVAHLTCHQDWPAVCMRRLWDLVRYDFQPPSSDTARRRSFLANGTDSSTKSALRDQARLGLNHLLSTQAVPHQIIDSKNGLVVFTVSACLSIWGSSIVFEGIRYVTVLSNKQEGKEFRLISTQKKKCFDTIYFVSNHLGVIALLFGETVLSKRERPGIWWSRFTACEKYCFLKGYTDGFKLRDLRLVESQYVDGIPAIRWSVLPPNPKTVWYVNLDDRAHSAPFFRILDCGKPGITGYSACMLDGDLVYLHYHAKGEDFSFYYEGGGDRLHAVWLHFPMEKGERVIEVWRRRKRPQLCRDIPMLRTNKGRVFVLGTYISSHDVSLKYDRLTVFPKPEHARFWYSYREGCVDYLAFDSEDKRQDKNDFRRTLEGPLALCSSGVGNQVFATTAQLEDIVEVVPCRSWVPGSTGIVGLVFTYSDGHREAVGQVRLDHLLSPIRVEPTGDMWLGVRYLSYGTVVEAMRLIPSTGKTIYGGNSSEAGLHWYRIVWRGRLDWLFWYGRCFVSYHEQPVSDEHVGKILEAQAGREWEKEMPHRR